MNYYSTNHWHGCFISILTQFNQFVTCYFMCLYDLIFDKHHYIDFHWVQCNIPTTLALGKFRCFFLISTKFVVVIAIASSYRFKCKYHILDSPVYACWSQSAKYCFYRKVHNFQMVITVSKTSHISYKLVSTEY